MSGGLGRKDETVLECPFCHKGKVRVFHKEGYLQPRVSRISAGRKVKYYRIPDTYQVLEGCPICKRGKKDIELELEGKYADRAKAKRRLEQLKAQGIPARFEIHR
ncbi:MAG: hypothetical protein AB1512_02670 [Thermodesulfobacteriota bacterium]